MNIIFVTSKRVGKGAGSSSLTLSHGESWLIGVALFSLLLAASLLYFGYRLGHEAADVQQDAVATAERTSQDVDAERDLEEVRQQHARLRLQMRSAKTELTESRQWIDENLNIVASRVAELQSRVKRIEVLGTKLLQDSDLDKGEFDFLRTPKAGVNSDLTLESQVDVPRLVREIDGLIKRIEDREEQLELLDFQLGAYRTLKGMMPSGKPVKGGWVSSGYGYRKDPVTGKRRLHRGMDFAGRIGTPVKTVAAGVVTQSGKSGAYGLLVEIDHGQGLVTRYAHNKRVLVKVGDVVQRGDRISLLGNTGKSTGPHLHFEVRRDGKTLNPRKFVYNKL